jgi:hypothetical protein
MAVVIDATVGGVSANSYCTKAEADTYHDGHPYASTWTAATDDQKNRALVTATALLDRHIDWYGYVVSYTQALLWPRNGMFYRNRDYVLTTVVPQELKNATAELARQILDADRTKDNDIETQALTQLSAGPVSMSFDANKVTAKVIPDAVFYMIEPWGTLRTRSGDRQVPLGRV